MDGWMMGEMDGGDTFSEECQRRMAALYFVYIINQVIHTSQFKQWLLSDNIGEKTVTVIKLLDQGKGNRKIAIGYMRIK